MSISEQRERVFGVIDSLEITRGAKIPNSGLSGIHGDFDSRLLHDIGARVDIPDEGDGVGESFWPEITEPPEVFRPSFNLHSSTDDPPPPPDTAIATFPVGGDLGLEVSKDEALRHVYASPAPGSVIGIDASSEDDQTVVGESSIDSKGQRRTPDLENPHLSPKDLSESLYLTTSRVKQRITSTEPFKESLMTLARNRGLNPEQAVHYVQQLIDSEDGPQPGEFLGDEDKPVYTEETRWVGTPDFIEEPTSEKEEDPDTDRFIG